MWSEKKQQVLSASCLHYDRVSGPHKSVYSLVKQAPRSSSSFNNYVRHTVGRELKKLHLERTVLVYWNVCCGWKNSPFGEENDLPSIILKAIPGSKNVSASDFRSAPQSTALLPCLGVSPLNVTSRMWGIHVIANVTTNFQAVCNPIAVLLFDG